MEKVTWTVDDVMDLNPCWSRAAVQAAFGDAESLSFFELIEACIYSKRRPECLIAAELDWLVVIICADMMDPGESGDMFGIGPARVDLYIKCGSRWVISACMGVLDELGLL